MRAAGLRDEAPPTLYLPAGPQRPLLHSLEVRASGDPSALAGEVRRVVRALAPDLPILGVRTMRQQVDRTVTPERLLAALAAAFGVAALLLVSVGVHGVAAQWVAERTAEVGVRMALGATPARARWLVLRQAVALLLAGVALGGPAAVVASRLLDRVLFETALDAATLAGAGLLLAAVVVLATYLPARRASRLDPMVALRHE